MNYEREPYMMLVNFYLEPQTKGILHYDNVKANRKHGKIRG